MKKYLLSVCVLSLLHTTQVMASTTIENGKEDYSTNQSFEGLDIGPGAQIRFCPLDDKGNCDPKGGTLNFTVENDLVQNGGTVSMNTANLSQTTSNRTQGIVLKNDASFSMENANITSKSRLELNSGANMVVGAASNITITGDTTQASNGQTVPGEVKIIDSSLSLNANTFEIEGKPVLDLSDATKVIEETQTNDDGTSVVTKTKTAIETTTITKEGDKYIKTVIKKDDTGTTTTKTEIKVGDTTVSNNSVLTAENAVINLSAKEEEIDLDGSECKTTTTTETIIKDKEGKENSSKESATKTDKTEGTKVEVALSSRIQADSDINLKNSSINMNVSKAGQEREAQNVMYSGGSITLTETTVKAPNKATENAEYILEPDITLAKWNGDLDTIAAQNDFVISNTKATLTGVGLEAGNDMTLKTNATSISANAGNNMTIQGDYQGLVAATGNNMVINASINGGGLVAGEKIDYQSGKAYLSGLYAKETTVHKGVDLTLSYGYGGGDIIVNGTLAMENFQLTNKDAYNNAYNSATNNVYINNSSFNATWNNEIDGDLKLTNSTMNMKKNANNDGWLKVNDVNVVNSDVDLDAAYIESSGTISIDKNSTVSIRIAGNPTADKQNYGHIIADTLNIENGAKMVLTVDGDAVTKGKTLNYELFDANTQNGSIALQQNSRYTYVDKGDGTYDITLNKTASDMAGEQTGSEELSGMAGSLLDGAASDNKFVQHLNELSQTPGREKDFADGLEILAPSMAAYVSALATDTTRQIYNVIGDRFDRDSYRSRRTRTSMPSNSLWAQGLVSNGEFEGTRAFETESKGGAIGFDVDLCHGCRVGLGYAYTMSDITSKGREIDVDSHTAIVYADLQSDPMFFNVIASYTRSMYNESKDVIGLIANADYDVDVLAAQAMLGYDMGAIRLSRNWRTGSFIPQIGFRYMNIKQKGYTDSADQTVSDAEAQTMTGIAGLHYTADYKMGPVIFYPDLHAAVTYDFVSDELSATSSLAGSNPYTITAERLDELGVELGAEVGLRIANRVDIALSYLGMFRKDYTNHTGFANLRYRF